MYGLRTTLPSSGGSNPKEETAMRVSDIMTTEIAVAERDTTAEEIATMMRDENVGAIPVVDEENALEGIVTDRDIVVRCIAHGRDPAECTAEDIMTDDCHAVAPDIDVKEAARIMAKFQVRRLPVVEDGELVGMLSIGDVAVKEGNDDLSGDALQEISQGVRDEGMPGGEGSAAFRMREGQRGASRSGVKSRGERRPKEEPYDGADRRRQPQGLRSEASSRKQGIANRSAREENARNDKVVPFRKENEVRNKNVAKPKRASRKRVS
jgi:CBS domain-containing protein